MAKKKRHERSGVQSASSIFHDEHTNYMALHPRKIGLENIVLSTAEAHMLSPAGILIRQPDDLFFDPFNKIVYGVEYKGKDNSNGRQKAKQQLGDYKSILEQCFPGYEVVKLYVSGNYNVERW